MKLCNPKTFVAVASVTTLCLIMVMMEGGIVFRSDHGDVEESRKLLSHMTDVLMGLTAGLFAGHVISKEEKNENNP